MKFNFPSQYNFTPKRKSLFEIFVYSFILHAKPQLLNRDLTIPKFLSLAHMLWSECVPLNSYVET